VLLLFDKAYHEKIVAIKEQTVRKIKETLFIIIFLPNCPGWLLSSVCTVTDDCIGVVID
jgi:hypothetical protein